MKGTYLFVSEATAIAVMTISALAAPLAFDVCTNLPSTASSISGDEQSHVILAQTQSGNLSALDVKGVSGVPLPLAIHSKKKLSENNLYAVSGLPNEAALSAGERRNQTWMVKQSDIHSLTLSMPKGYSGSFHVVVTRWEDAVRPVETSVFLVNISDDKSPTNVVSSRPASHTTAAKPYIRTQKENILFNRAMQQFKKTDVAGARSLLEYLASKGDPEAAFALGKSYDPIVLRKMYLQGVEPDIEKAQEWYVKASELGNPQAQSHIEMIDNH
jgi:hypothetical protein